MVFRPAKIFRRIGPNAFAVQLKGCPGVVQVFCTDMDWGVASSSSHTSRQFLADLELRLCKLGTRSMFSVQRRAATTETADAVAVKCSVQPVGFHEGVEISLGPYDPNRHAFVQCKLRVVSPVSSSSSSSSSLLPNVHHHSVDDEKRKRNQESSCVPAASGDGGVDGKCDRPVPVEEGVRPRKIFKWLETV